MPTFGLLPQIIVVGIGAGLAAALLFVAVFTGTFFAYPLFALSALPIGLATFGWGPLSGGLATAVSTGTLALADQPTLAIGFAILVGGPALWVAMVAGQPARVTQSGTHRTAVFRPLAEVLIHTAGIVALAVITVGVFIRFDPTVAARAFLDAFVQSAPAVADMSRAELRAQLAPVVRVMFNWLPVTAAPSVMTMLVINSWLAARITALSGRLERPWTPMADLRLPLAVTVVLLVGLAGGFLPGGIGLAFNVAASAAGFALALAGLATLHTVTMGRPNRALILGVAYALTVILSVPIILWTLLGVVDSATDFRRRFAGGNNPQA